MSRPTDVAKKVPNLLWIFLGFFVAYMISRMLRSDR
jgi:hypothetical protein